MRRTRRYEGQTPEYFNQQIQTTVVLQKRDKKRYNRSRRRTQRTKKIRKTLQNVSKKRRRKK